MTNAHPPAYQEPQTPEFDDPLPCDAEAERDLIGLVFFREENYDRAALKPSDFYIDRYRWMWEAFGVIRAEGDHIDESSTARQLIKAGLFEDVIAYGSLYTYWNTEARHLDAKARRLRQWVERRRMLAEATALARQAWDPDTLIPDIPARPRIQVRTAAWALQPRDPLEMVIEPIISRGSVNLFYGEPGAKKTYAMLSLGICAARGRPWLNMPTHACKVLIIDEESGERRLSLRLAAALRGELAWEDTPLEFISLAGFTLDDPEDVRLLEEQILLSGAGLVIFDALADLMKGDENSKQDTHPALNTLRRLAEHTQAAMCIIHHTNRTGGYRGSSAIKGAVDLMVQVTSKNGSEFVNFKTEKNRDGPALSWSARCSWVEQPETFSMLPVEMHLREKALSRSQEYVLRYLDEHGPSPLPGIMDAADVCSDNAARQAIYSLVTLGKVCRTNPGARPAVYALVDKELKALISV